MIKKIRYVLPILLWSLLIFSFSSQKYENQDITPWLNQIPTNVWLTTLLSKISFTYEGMEISIQALGMAHFLEFFIRKGAHFFVFFVLGFLTIRAINHSLRRKGISILFSFTFVMIYAGLDEFHQQFTEGRSPLFSDVMVDSVGGLFGIIFYLYVKNKPILIGKGISK